MVMSITADSLLLRPKLDYDVGYDAVVKGASIVVRWTLVPVGNRLMNPGLDLSKKRIRD
jgi:hypothetical protein